MLIEMSELMKMSEALTCIYGELLVYDGEVRRKEERNKALRLLQTLIKIAEKNDLVFDSDGRIWVPRETSNKE